MLHAADLSYQVGYGDTVEIIIESPYLLGKFRNPDRSIQVVRPDGKLTTPLIGADVLAVGRTVEKIQEDMERAFAPKNPWNMPVEVVVYVLEQHDINHQP
ncbi:MAG: hypothetical protein NPIRA02_29380 [Nitrospirales bacterium]|nr:MAG: hypothetical protein NPIRA02_29380 [Nitrospirales bacterium]